MVLAEAAIPFSTASQAWLRSSSIACSKVRLGQMAVNPLCPQPMPKQESRTSSAGYPVAVSISQ